MKQLKSALKDIFQGKRDEPPPKLKKAPRGPKVEARGPKENEFALGLEYQKDEKTGEEKFVLKGVDQKYRSTHFYIVGASGTGKTKFLEYLICQDILAQRGFGVIDPHGDLIEDIKGLLYLYSKKSLKNDVVLIDPTRKDKTVAFNPLETGEGLDSEKVADELKTALEKIWKDSWGPRMGNILHMSLLALAEAGFTMAELSLFLTNETARRKILAKAESYLCDNYFKEEFNSVSAKERRIWIEPILNKVNAFMARQGARNMLSVQKSSFNLRDIMDSKKILLVNLAKGQLGSVGDLLGSFLMSKIQMAAFSRMDLPRSKRIPFYLYIDEFQNFASKSFIATLAEARKYGLSLIMAHQSLSQLPEDLKSSILTNCGIQVYFRVSRQDADLLAKEGFRITSTEIKDMKIGKESVSPVYFTYPEEWETYIRGLQELPQRYCSVIQKMEGGATELYVEDVPFPWEMAKDITGERLEINEEKFKDMVEKAEIGKKYLRSRQSIEQESKKRREGLTVIKEPETFREPKLKVKHNEST